MSLLGFALVALGIWGSGWGIYSAFSAGTTTSRSRGKAWLGAFVAPVALLGALIGGILIFVPTFFGR